MFARSAGRRRGVTRRVALASESAIRARLLRSAGVAFDAEPARIDEDSVRESMRAEGASAAEAAAALAALKATKVSARRPEALVIGADQILTLGDLWLGKPADAGAARARLAELRGRAHTLETGVCIALGGSAIWRHGETSRLVMRPFSDGFLDAYIAACGADILGTVGAYRVEDRGVQLFSRIEGDYFAVLGLPLLPLLGFLREHGAVGR